MFISKVTKRTKFVNILLASNVIVENNYKFFKNTRILQKKRKRDAIQSIHWHHYLWLHVVFWLVLKLWLDLRSSQNWGKHWICILQLFWSCIQKTHLQLQIGWWKRHLVFGSWTVLLQWRLHTSVNFHKWPWLSDSRPLTSFADASWSCFIAIQAFQIPKSTQLGHVVLWNISIH